MSRYYFIYILALTPIPVQQGKDRSDAFSAKRNHSSTELKPGNDEIKKRHCGNSGGNSEMDFNSTGYFWVACQHLGRYSSSSVLYGERAIEFATSI